ncbi:MAG: hypothetical protein KDD06_19995 [Phaeodactylibacter sp.]|nr:hypothetical protein [Phaeodactylibacter sp.]MCB9267392.1 hypothetical protein [Lewinellaceae bacterium]MCB9288307.1 hypothetical protein [Lewinellaceae bacterium]
MINDNSRIATVDHEAIQSWAEAREARPARLSRFEDEQVPGRIKFRFPGDDYPDEEGLSWDEFFDIFDRERLEFVFEDIADEAVENGNLYQFRPREY